MFLKEVEIGCTERNIYFHHSKNHVRCLAHVINLTTQEILKHIKAGEAQDERIILEADSGEFINILPKLRKLIVKIRSSPQRQARFLCQCQIHNEDKLNLILDIKTRWNSTYLMLERAQKLRDVCKF
jgi:hypothetical protein